jgi:hypothetical protein
MTGFRDLVPGCRALVTSGMKAGTEVICLRHIGQITPAEHGVISIHDCWEVDRPMPWQQINGNHETMMLYMFPTKYLMRIDGDIAMPIGQETKIPEKIT